MSSTVEAVVLGDVHFPFCDVRSLKAAQGLIEELKPKHVIQVGDITDQYFASRYPKKFSLTPEEEFNLGRSYAEDMWEGIQKVSPKSKCWQLLGNHDVRFFKRIAERAPELQGIADIKGYFSFPGVETMDSDRDILQLKLAGNKVSFMHGYLSRLGDHARKLNGCVVTGHSHRPGIAYLRRGKDLIWEANAGYLGDEGASVFKYGQSNLKDWGRGVLIIDREGPRFVSFEGNRRLCKVQKTVVERK